MIFQDGFGSTAGSLFAEILGQEAPAMTPEAYRKLQEAVAVTVVRPPAKEITSGARLAVHAVFFALVGRLSRYRSIGILQPQFKQSRRTEINRDLYNATVTLALRWINDYRLDQSYYYPPDKADYVVTDEDVLADARGKAGDYCRAGMAARNYYPAAPAIVPTPRPAVRPTPTADPVIATPALIPTPAAAAVRPAAVPAVAPDAVSRMGPVSPEFLAQIVDEQMERYEIARMPGSIGGKIWAKIVKNASELYLINAFGLAVHPYSVFHAKIDLVIKDADVSAAESAIRRELGRRDYTQGRTFQADFVPPKGVTPEFGVGYQWPSAGKVASAGVQAGVASVVGRVPGRGERTLLTNDECSAILQVTMDAISRDQDAEHHAKLAAVMMGVKYSSRVAPGATTLRVVQAGAGFYKELSRLGIACKPMKSPELIVAGKFMGWKKEMKECPVPVHVLAVRVPSIKKTGFTDRYAELDPAGYDSLVQRDIEQAKARWPCIPPKFRTREVADGEWRAIALGNLTKMNIFRGKAPLEVVARYQRSSREAAERVIGLAVRHWTTGIPSGPLILHPDLWESMTGRRTLGSVHAVLGAYDNYQMSQASDQDLIDVLTSVTRPRRSLQERFRYIRYSPTQMKNSKVALPKMITTAMNKLGYAKGKATMQVNYMTPPPAVARAEVTPVAPRRAPESQIRLIVYQRAKRISSSKRRGKRARWLSSEGHEKFIRGIVADVLEWEAGSKAKLGFGQVTPTADTREAEIRLSVEKYMPTYAVLSIPPTVTPVMTPPATPVPTPPVQIILTPTITPVVTPPEITPVPKLILTPVVTPPEITPVPKLILTPVVTPPVITPVVTPPVITPVVTPPVITPVVTPPVRFLTEAAVRKKMIDEAFANMLKKHNLAPTSPAATYLKLMPWRELIGDLVYESRRLSLTSKYRYAIEGKKIDVPHLSEAEAIAGLKSRNYYPASERPREYEYTPPVIEPTPPLPLPTPVPTPPVPVLPTLDEWARTAPVFPNYPACVAAARAATGRVPDRYFHCTCIDDAVTRAVDNALEESEVTTKAITPAKYASVVSDAVNVGNQMVAQRTYTPAISGRRVAFPRRR